MFTLNRSGVWSDKLMRNKLAFAFAWSVITLVHSDSVFAQRYETIAVKLEDRAARSMKNQVANALRNPATFQSNGKSVIDSYFKTYLFPKMTQNNPGALATLGKNREYLLKFLRGATVKQAQDYLTGETLKAMTVMARGNYHPSVRYNAALVIGMLDQQYATSGANATPPTVLPTGTAELLQLLEQSEINKIKVHPSVKVAALDGLDRHLRFGIDAQQFSQRVTDAAMAVLAQDAASLEISSDVNNWMKCKAARLLVRQSKAGPSKELHAALTALVDSEEMSLEDRCCIVGLLEKMEFANSADADLAVMVVPLGKLTKAVVAEGSEKAEEFQQLILKGGISTRRGNSRNADEGPKLERRLLLARLTSIEKGATALSTGLADEEKQKLQSLTSLFMPVMEKSGDKKELDLEVTGEVINLGKSIDSLVASWQPAAAVTEEATDEAFSE